MVERRDGRWACTEPHVMVWPALIEPKEQRDDKGQPTGKRAYSAEFLFANDDPELNSALQKALEFYQDAFPRQLPSSFTKMLFHPRVVMAELGEWLNTPFIDGNDRAVRYESRGKNGSLWQGKTILRASSPEFKRNGDKNFPPALGGVVNGKPTNFDTPEKRAMATGLFYSGVNVKFEVSFDAYTQGKGGVKAYLRMVYSLGTGQRIGGVDVAERFGEHVGQFSMVDPLA